jgi:hypothetical protein
MTSRQFHENRVLKSLAAAPLVRDMTGARIGWVRLPNRNKQKQTSAALIRKIYYLRLDQQQWTRKPTLSSNFFRTMTK